MQRQEKFQIVEPERIKQRMRIISLLVVLIIGNVILGGWCFVYAVAAIFFEKGVPWFSDYVVCLFLVFNAGGLLLLRRVEIGLEAAEPAGKPTDEPGISRRDPDPAAPSGGDG